MKLFQPLFSTVLVQVADPKEEGAIKRPDIVRTDPPMHGVVAAVGEFCEYAEIGDPCIFNPWAGTEVEVDGRLYRYIAEAELLGVGLLDEPA